MSADPKQDWKRECAIAGAAGAARVLGRILERSTSDEGPSVEELAYSELSAKLFEGEPVVAVFADLVGAASGQAGLVVTTAAAHELVEALLSAHEVEVASPRAQSALAELGNIALSAACGEMARCVDGVVMPSVPRLGSSLEEALLVDGGEHAMQRLPVYVADTGLCDASGTLSLRFVWLPF